MFIDLAALLTIFGWSFFSFWTAIPAGVALNVPPVWVVVTVTLSYALGVIVVLVAGTPLRERIRRRMERKAGAGKPNRTMETVQKVWDRYGLIGLSLLAPMTVGSQVGAVIGLSLGAKPVRLAVMMTLGAALWSIVLTLAVIAGVVAVT